MNTNHLFIVFEGLDGSGITAQSELLCNYLNSIEEYCHLTKEPTEGPIGHLIKEFLQGRIRSKNVDMNMYKYLFLADRCYHNNNPVDGLSKIIKMKHIVCSRYYFSNLAYNTSTIVDMNNLYNLNTIFLQPDIVFYLDITPETSIMRIRNRHVKETTEAYEKLCEYYTNYKTMFLDENKSSYMLPIHSNKTKIITILGTLSKNEIHDQIKDYITRYLDSNKSQEDM